MFYQHSNGSATLPRGFRFHHEEGPTTPEPEPADELRQPSPPRPRLKVRRRNVSNLQAPTDQFLASVAAADVPIPTIEIPTNTNKLEEDSEMPDRDEISVQTPGLLAPQTSNFRSGSPPKTPVPMLSMDEAASQRPDWSMCSRAPSEDYLSRPASSLSYASDCSDDSLYSGSRVSRPSDDGSCTSPDSEMGDPFKFPILKRKGSDVTCEEPAQAATTLNGNLRSKTRKDAPWTKAQSAHLWSTYLIYLQDPTVTPFRIGASAVPPEGVCHRVAREARRSWKGPQLTTPSVRRSSRLASSRTSVSSGSITPTAESSKTYAQWQHSSSATRNHLRELCRSKDNTSVSRHRHLQSRSPTPFTKPSLRPRLQTPEPSRVSSFSTQDIALSLATSTSKSMQPDGPLAKLASSDGAADAPVSLFTPFDSRLMGFGGRRSLGDLLDEEDRARRLGSPFTARTYGPSSSKLLNPFDNRPSPPLVQSDSISGPRLRSPLRFDKPHSLNNTQKRRAQHDLEDELSPNGAIVRPRILNEQLFGTPLNSRRVRSRGYSLGDEALRNRVPGIFTSVPIVEFIPPPRTQPAEQDPLMSVPKLLPSVNFAPPRLGSPFSESGPSQTFPRRLFQDNTATIRRSAFATMHQTRRSIESFDFGEGPSLQSRLEQLDMKLKQIREREAASKRQSSG